MNSSSVEKGAGMDAHRRVAPSFIKVFPVGKGFSCFDFVDDRFDELGSLRRCFSLARSFGFRTLVVESILPDGLIREENEELTALFSDYAAGSLVRLTFWRSAFRAPNGVDASETEDLIGFAIAKCDNVPSRKLHEWHLFDAVFRKYEHEHNCLPCMRPHRIRVVERELQISGRLYCQQNDLNKSCAQVALRSLLSGRLPTGDISYRRINELARPAGRPQWVPANGLSTMQIRRVLDQLHIGHRDINYPETEKTDPEIRRTHPFQKFVYAGVESGAGALLGFSMAGPGLNVPGKHMIPFFGHTFNKDTWVPDAEQSYFDVGGGLGYIPSECWTSSFLGHDDNFGPNFCVPRLYIRPEQVDYVSELLPDSAFFSGVQAETVSIRFVYSLRPMFLKTTNRWLLRLAHYSRPDIHNVILRAVCVPKNLYVAHLKNVKDWDGHAENPKLPDLLAELLPACLWVVEVSIPHLFQANERKLGEVVLDASRPLASADPLSFDSFRLARVPTRYLLVGTVKKGTPQFIEVPSSIESHVPLLRL